MRIINFTLASWFAACGLLTAESTAPVPAPTAPTSVQADPTAEALPILQAKYVGFADLHYKDGDRLSELAARSDGRISLYMPETVAPTPILTAALPGGIAYCRLGSFQPQKDWTGLAHDLRTLIDWDHVVGVVIDLRGNASTDYAGAAQMLSFLAPGDSSLFKYLRQDKPGFVQLPAEIPNRQLEGPLVVITNGQTAAAAEALAGCLKSDGALVVGRATAGTSFEEDKLANGEILRFAIALPPQPGDTLMRPVAPDIALTVDDHNEKAALMLIRENHVLDVIQESAERKRMSEASLVKGQDPEWDAYLASLESKSMLLSLPSIHDPVLVTALDSVRAIRITGSPVAEPASQAAPQAAASNAAAAPGTSVQ